MKASSAKRFSNLLFSVLLFIGLSACSSMSPAVKESFEDLRATLPKPLRGEEKALEEYPTPQLQGAWEDDGFPELAIRLSQAGNRFSINRSGKRYGIVVNERLNAQLEGRSVKAVYVNNPPDAIRPTTGDCHGTVSKNSNNIRLTCQYQGQTIPLNFTRL